MPQPNGYPALVTLDAILRAVRACEAKVDAVALAVRALAPKSAEQARSFDAAFQEALSRTPLSSADRAHTGPGDGPPITADVVRTLGPGGARRLLEDIKAKPRERDARPAAPVLRTPRSRQQETAKASAHVGRDRAEAMGQHARARGDSRAACPYPNTRGGYRAAWLRGFGP